MPLERMRIGVMGAGSIGCYVGGRLAAAGSADVVLVGRARLRDEIARHGLHAVDMGKEHVARSERLRFETEAASLDACDAVLVCVKSAQTAEVARELAGIVRADCVVVSLQNGMRNAETLRVDLGSRVVAGIVGFNVVSKGDGVFFRGTTGPIQLESTAGSARVARAMRDAGLEVELSDALEPLQWTKLMLNLNNAVSALSGAPTVELLTSPGYRKVVAAVIEEALGVLAAAKLRAAPLRGIPMGIMPTVLRLPTWVVRIVTRRQMKVDPEARSSMWEDLSRGRLTEVEYLNGEIVRLADRVGAAAPINRKIVELVHAAEANGDGSPKLDAARLWSALAG